MGTDNRSDNLREKKKKPEVNREPFRKYANSENDNDLELDWQKIKHGCSRFLGETAAHCGKKIIAMWGYPELTAVSDPFKK